MRSAKKWRMSSDDRAWGKECCHGLLTGVWVAQLLWGQLEFYIYIVFIPTVPFLNTCPTEIPAYVRKDAWLRMLVTAIHVTRKRHNLNIHRGELFSCDTSILQNIYRSLNWGNCLCTGKERNLRNIMNWKNRVIGCYHLCKKEMKITQQTYFAICKYICRQLYAKKIRKDIY